MSKSPARLGFVSIASILGVSLLAAASQATPVPSTSMSSAGSLAEGTLAQSPAKAPTSAPAKSPGSVVDVASGNDAFKTLVAAVKAAGLAEKLSEAGPFTILAPTDEAFAELPDGVLQALLKPENKDLLTQILAYHVVPEELKFNQFRGGALKTLNGSVAIKLMTDRIVINNASIVQADVEADNGVIQVISRVLIPPKVAEELQTRLAAATPPEPEMSPEPTVSSEPAVKAQPASTAQPVRGLW